MLPKIVSHAVVTEVANELLVYDAKTQTAHCLGEIGLIVFKSCQQNSTREEAIDALRALSLSEPEAVLEETLSLLTEKNLLVDSESKGFDRRRFLAAAGVAVALPVVASVLAPLPSQAVSCVDCQVDGTLQPLSCATCGNNCPAGGCAGTSRCCFEYRINSNNPIGAGACNGTSGGAGGQEGIGIYSCRAVPGGSVFSNLCDTARDLTITNNFGGSLAAANTALYYCCRCPGSNPIFTCP
jgi:hypothetical protein